MTLVDSAPAPLTAPVKPDCDSPVLNEPAAETATAAASIVGDAVAVSEMPLGTDGDAVVALHVARPLIEASTTLSMSLRASETPMASAAPALPAATRASDPPWARDVIFDVSVAVSATLPATRDGLATTLVESADTYDLMSTAMRLVASAPTPAPAHWVVLFSEPAKFAATAKASTSASIVGVNSVVAAICPPAVSLELLT